MKPRHPVFIGVGILLLVFCGGALAVAIAPATPRQLPTTILESPPGNSEYHAGETVAVQSLTTGADGVGRVELSVDGVIVTSDAPTPVQKYVRIIQSWKAVEGVHTITIRAYNPSNQPGTPAAIRLMVLPAAVTNLVPAPSPSPTLVVVPGALGTLTPAPVTPTSMPIAGQIPASQCNNSAFVMDVTVPDFTMLAQGQTFNKIWRVLNTGTCTWGSGYTFEFTGGEGMGGSPIAVPYTAPAATADLLVPMTAPLFTGNHTGFWRLRDPQGSYFGSTLDVAINVVETGQGVQVSSYCNAAAGNAYFVASSNYISSGNGTTLIWSIPSNATYVWIDNGIGGVGTQGSINVYPGATTTYNLTAQCGGYTQYAQVTVYVNYSVCSGTPSISYFNASSTTISPGASTSLNWGLVGNADNVQIDNDIGGVATPGSITVSPGSTKTYTMSAYCGSDLQTAQVTINVGTPTKTPTPQTWINATVPDSGTRPHQGTGPIKIDPSIPPDDGDFSPPPASSTSSSPPATTPTPVTGSGALATGTATPTSASVPTDAAPQRSQAGSTQTPLPPSTATLAPRVLPPTSAPTLLPAPSPKPPATSSPPPPPKPTAPPAPTSPPAPALPAEPLPTDVPTLTPTPNVK